LSTTSANQCFPSTERVFDSPLVPATPRCLRLCCYLCVTSYDLPGGWLPTSTLLTLSEIKSHLGSFRGSLQINFLEPAAYGSHATMAPQNVGDQTSGFSELGDTRSTAPLPDKKPKLGPRCDYRHIQGYALHNAGSALAVSHLTSDVLSGSSMECASLDGLVAGRVGALENSALSSHELPRR